MYPQLARFGVSVSLYVSLSLSLYPSVSLPLYLCHFLCHSISLSLSLTLSLSLSLCHSMPLPLSLSLSHPHFYTFPIFCHFMLEASHSQEKTSTIFKSSSIAFLRHMIYTELLEISHFLRDANFLCRGCTDRGCHLPGQQTGSIVCGCSQLEM